MKRVLLAGMGFGLFLLIAQAAEQPLPEKVIKQDGKVLAVSGGKAAPFEKPIAFPGGVLVSTNGQFTVKKGKVRELKEGQALTAEGVLFNPDGSVAPVTDHIVVRGGKVLVVKDGEPSPLTQNIRLPNGAVLTTDATIRSGGRIQRLLDGHLLTLEGKPLQAQDTIGMQKGKVFVFKDGARIELQPAQMIVMNDGTRVYGNGKVVGRDGRTQILKEGDLLLVEGPTLSLR